MTSRIRDTKHSTRRKIRRYTPASVLLMAVACGPLPPSAEEVARAHLGNQDPRAFGCRTWPVALSDTSATVLACTGAMMAGTSVLLVVDHVAFNLGISRPGVDVDVYTVDLTGDGVPEVLHTSGGGGTHSHSLTLTIHQWQPDGPTHLQSVLLRDSPILGEPGTQQAFIATGVPLCIAPAEPTADAYEMSRVATGPGWTLEFDAESGQFVHGGPCVADPAVAD